MTAHAGLGGRDIGAGRDLDGVVAVAAVEFEADVELVVEPAAWLGDRDADVAVPVGPAEEVPDPSENGEDERDADKERETDKRVRSPIKDLSHREPFYNLGRGGTVFGRSYAS